LIERQTLFAHIDALDQARRESQPLIEQLPAGGDGLAQDLQESRAANERMQNDLSASVKQLQALQESVRAGVDTAPAVSLLRSQLQRASTEMATKQRTIDKLRIDMMHSNEKIA